MDNRRRTFGDTEVRATVTADTFIPPDGRFILATAIKLTTFVVGGERKV